MHWPDSKNGQAIVLNSPVDGSMMICLLGISHFVEIGYIKTVFIWNDSSSALFLAKYFCKAFKIPIENYCYLSAVSAY